MCFQRANILAAGFLCWSITGQWAGILRYWYIWNCRTSWKKEAATSIFTCRYRNILPDMEKEKKFSIRHYNTFKSKIIDGVVKLNSILTVLHMVISYVLKDQCRGECYHYCLQYNRQYAYQTKLLDSSRVTLLMHFFALLFLLWSLQNVCFR